MVQNIVSSRELAVSCSDVVVAYGAFEAISAVSFDARFGEVLTLLGPNGAGKSTTFLTLEGYRGPVSGTVSVLGLDPIKAHGDVVKVIGVMLQRGGVYPMIDARKILSLFASFYENPRKPDELLETLDLSDAAKKKTPWKQLSGGEAARLSLALALIGRPRVVFLDEPTAGVDPEGRQIVRSVISELKESGVCVLLATHELSEAERLSDRVIIMDAGKIVATGTPKELAARQTYEHLEFRSSPTLDVAQLSSLLRASVTEDSSGHYRIIVSKSSSKRDETAHMTATLAGWIAELGAPLLELHAGSSLEQTYLSVIQKAGQDQGQEP